MPASAFQLASIAAKSTVRRPPASVSTGAGGCAGRKSGSCRVMAGFMAGRRARVQCQVSDRALTLTRPSPAFSCDNADPLYRLRHLLLAREIGEARDVRLELQFHRTGRAVTLLADDHFSGAVNRFHLGLPLNVFVGPRLGLFVAEVVFLAEHEQHDVGILLN